MANNYIFWPTARWQSWRLVSTSQQDTELFEEQVNQATTISILRQVIRVKLPKAACDWLENIFSQCVIAAY